MREMIFLAALLGGDGFFERRDVDFWGARRANVVPAPDLWPEATAPATVRKLLDAPTRENARAYLEWQSARLKRLREAVAAVDEAQRERSPAILYFSRPGCRWCALQEEELRDLPVARVPEGSPLWKEHGVTVTPTVVVNGRAFRGLTPRAAILKEMKHE